MGTERGRMRVTERVQKEIKPIRQPNPIKNKFILSQQLKQNVS